MIIAQAATAVAAIFSALMIRGNITTAWPRSLRQAGLLRARFSITRGRRHRRFRERGPDTGALTLKRRLGSVVVIKFINFDPVRPSRAGTLTGTVNTVAIRHRGRRRHLLLRASAGQNMWRRAPVDAAVTKLIWVFEPVRRFSPSVL